MKISHIPVFIAITKIPPQPMADELLKISKTIQPPGNMTKQETIDEWHNGTGKYVGAKEKAVMEKYLSLAWDDRFGSISTISYAIGVFGEVQTISAEDHTEKELLQSFVSVLDAHIESQQQCASQDNHVHTYLVGHYLRGVLGSIIRRAQVNGVKLNNHLLMFFRGQDFQSEGYSNSDTQCLWTGSDHDRISLFDLWDALIYDPIFAPERMNDREILEAWTSGNTSKVVEYSSNLLTMTRDVYKKQLSVIDPEFYERLG